MFLSIFLASCVLEKLQSQNKGMTLDATGLVQSLLVTFMNFKHNYNKTNFTIVVGREPKACPVQSYLDYINVSGNMPGPLYRNRDGSRVSRSDFTKILLASLKISDLDPNRYKGHSFRIGAATYAAEKGFTDVQIR